MSLCLFFQMADLLCTFVIFVTKHLFLRLVLRCKCHLFPFVGLSKIGIKLVPPTCNDNNSMNNECLTVTALLFFGLVWVFSIEQSLNTLTYFEKRSLPQ